ncbi:hypothetical protein BST81_23410 [Leptolyngbya sp. 'hensonii']|uniref:GNAT family N-acetyltransferase n=1 Tax=Leptolyngbya sp. 'hensonii' TaxID=1922337 RepID=UPI0009500456|nr:GNAT family N-acetyltransferase [Leptolyngbya sp. 'hensonii']OLP16009.1 hypothetical protein BST81_23410 [Leptolyngbya sp. 'hensonii']
MSSVLSRIRPATLTDIAAIQKIAHQSWVHTYEGIIPDEVQAQAIATWYSTPALQVAITSGQSVFLVAEAEEQIIGFAQFVCRLNGVAELSRIHIMPENQGVGIGTALVDLGLHAVQKMGLRTVMVAVEAMNAKARSFYERRGFVEHSESEFSIFGYSLSLIFYQLPSVQCP